MLDWRRQQLQPVCPEVGSPGSTPTPSRCWCPAPPAALHNTFWGKTDEDGKVIEHYDRRAVRDCLKMTRAIARSDYRFAPRSPPGLRAENDIAARRRQHRDQPLADPDDKLKGGAQSQRRLHGDPCAGRR